MDVPASVQVVPGPGGRTGLSPSRPRGRWTHWPQSKSSRGSILLEGLRTLGSVLDRRSGGDLKGAEIERERL